jgi:hypothetical protein
MGFAAAYFEKPPGMLAMGTPDVARLGGQPVYFDGKPPFKTEDMADPKLAKLMVDGADALVKKVHATRDLVITAANDAGIDLDLPIKIEPIFEGNKTDGLRVTDLRLRKRYSVHNPLTAMQLLDRALANVGLEVSECTQSLPDERAASFTFRLKTAPDFTTKYTKWVTEGVKASVQSYVGEEEKWAMGHSNGNHEAPPGGPPLAEKPAWKGPDESKSHHQNLTDFFITDSRRKK